MLLDKLYNKLLFKYYNVSIGKDFRCKGKLLIQGHGKYTIGNNANFISHKYVNPIGGDRIVLQTLNNSAEIKIGNNVGISHAVISSKKSIIIEDDVLIGSGTKLFDSDFHSINFEDRLNGDNDVISKEIKIEKGVFIGADSIVLKGVTIGEHSIVGAGSVVTKSIPKNEIWAGNPAKFIKKMEEV